MAVAALRRALPAAGPEVICQRLSARGVHDVDDMQQLHVRGGDDLPRFFPDLSSHARDSGVLLAPAGYAL
ncbi:hypothetical protein GCM10010272_66270 [Streptomyces lateritius]|nr:hypothetical protein GCM10010272_66270 [Streptomyces lateritius]